MQDVTITNGAQTVDPALMRTLKSVPVPKGFINIQFPKAWLAAIQVCGKCVIKLNDEGVCVQCLLAGQGRTALDRQIHKAKAQSKVKEVKNANAGELSFDSDADE